MSHGVPGAAARQEQSRRREEDEARRQDQEPDQAGAQAQAARRQAFHGVPPRPGALHLRGQAPLRRPAVTALVA